jgi:dihydrofolate synthase/folylpolyglutamate synthase
MNDLQKYEEFIGKFTKSGKRAVDLARIGALLSSLGNPQDGLKFIHLAGTNGKGSCSEMLARTLTSAGYKTGLFTSPYIVCYNDRIRTDGKNISDEELNALA